MTAITFFVPGSPRPQGSKRAFTNPKTGGVILTESAGAPLKDWRTSVAVVAQSHFDTPRTDPVVVSIRFVLRRPKTLPKRVQHHVKRPDIDKLARAVLDALTGTAIHDDSQVYCLDLTKAYWATTGAHISIGWDEETT